ncbi:LVIVD repeat-containing protein [Streptomyces sp. 4N509B]|uniref:LVIVD repeat-containing protein n=1 Tax=Streptomyces sp. 4N509B TaxID=3457413 RepID=UPI003FD0BCAC
MTTPQRPSRARRRLATLAVATCALASLILPGTASAAPDPVVAPDVAASGTEDVSSSDNISLLANVPDLGAFTGTNSDLAFQDDYAFLGSYDGFSVYDISRPRHPELVSQVLCYGPQNDISVSGDLLFLSVDLSLSDDSCSASSLSATNESAWEGVRVFDISDIRNPRYVAAVETPCGSHTHTLVPERRNVYVYVSSYGPNANYPDCQPPHDGISVVKVPRHAPERAELASFDLLFPDGGFPGSDRGSATSGCHDITAYPALDLAAGACMGDGILMDISDPAAPRVIDQVTDADHFAFWHSATFSQDGRKVVFTDELGGGIGATCNEETGPEFGADGIYHIRGRGDGRHLDFQGYFKIPRHQADTENCVAHNGSLIPARGRDIMVQAWYQGGLSVVDFTDSSDPVEIAHFDRGPVNPDELAFGGTWSIYYYNGHIYSNGQAGFDVLRIDDRRTDSARHVRLDELNAQTQPTYR